MVNFEDQDWEELGAQARRVARDAANAWKIAAGVAIGMATGGGLVYVVDHGMAQRGLSAAARSLQQMVRAANPAGAMPPKAPASAAEQVAARPDNAAPATAVAGSQIPSTLAPAAPTGGAREAESAQHAQQEAAAQKELAWARYYIKPAQCDVNAARDTIVECANHYIRARRAFEAAYVAGKR